MGTKPYSVYLTGNMTCLWIWTWNLLDLSPPFLPPSHCCPFYIMIGCFFPRHKSPGRKVTQRGQMSTSALICIRVLLIISSTFSVNFTSDFQTERVSSTLSDTFFTFRRIHVFRNIKKKHLFSDCCDGGQLTCCRLLDSNTSSSERIACSVVLICLDCSFSLLWNVFNSWGAKSPPSLNNLQEE